jgi:hypothetical protein
MYVVHHAYKKKYYEQQISMYVPTRYDGNRRQITVGSVDVESSRGLIQRLHKSFIVPSLQGVVTT